MTEIFLPLGSVPCTILALLVEDASSKPSSSTKPASGSKVVRGTPLFRYAVTREGSDEPDALVYESPTEGEVTEVCVRQGQQIRSLSTPIIRIHEPCLHTRIFHGLCSDCGTLLTEVDYAGPTHVSRATVRMSHHDEELLVSQAEAERLERDTADRLLGARKLSLIVDLDQTVIHATVDPTVGEWMQQPSNPNYDALRGVSTFKLARDGAAVPLDSEGSDQEDDGCTYYVKMRPGLKGFLETMSELYEMHVYTMGTRSYAEQVCRIIDPHSKLFGGRILSRSETENQGLTSKSLQRLFPCDTSMVVIIDDRADVWEWSPNLVKVVPYDFFVGIGDINGAFLPKRSVIDTAPPGEKVETPLEPVSATKMAADAPNSVLQEAEANQVIEEQVNSRPLLKAQEALHAVAVDKQKAASVKTDSEPDGEAEEVVIDGDASHLNGDIVVSPSDEPVAGEEAVLKDDDVELDRLRAVLKRIHLDFYDAQGANRDVRVIIPAMKRNVLDGVGILFSGVIPLSTAPSSSEIWKLAIQFGATCHDKLTKGVTHLVAAKSDTAKVNAARRRRDVTIVWAAWLFDCLAQWRRQDEQLYLIEPEKAAGEPVIIVEEPSEPPKSPSEASDLEVADAEQSHDIPVDLNWADADAELDAMLNETDDSDVEGPITAGNKRSRSRTASFEPEGTASPTGSPLSKRQRLASSRSSKLKLSIDANGTQIDASPRASPQPDSGKTAPTTTDDSDDEDFAALAAQMT